MGAGWYEEQEEEEEEQGEIQGGEEEVEEGDLEEGGQARVRLAEEVEEWASVDMAASAGHRPGWRFGCQPAVEKTHWSKGELAGQLADELLAGWLASVWSSSLSHCTAHTDPSPPPRSGSTRLRTGPRGNLCLGSLAKVLVVRCTEDSSQRVRAGKGEIHLENLHPGNLPAASKSPHQKLPLPERAPSLLHIQLRWYCNLEPPLIALCNHPL